jgi:Ser/Thr protein kinase RdoA (MazF antagonist)
MEKRIRELYTPAVLHEAIRRYGIQESDLEAMDGFESSIYAYPVETPDGLKRRFLRISHSLHRSAEMIHGEVDFINYLADHGVPAARAIPSPSGEWVEVIPVSEGHFSAVTFTEAQGHTPRGAEDWNEALIRQLGAVTGRMHRLTQRYQPANPAWKRPDWRSELRGFAEAFLPADQADITARWNAVLDEMERLPQTPANFGLVHQDLHGGNFHVQDGAITLFDFDDCHYTWFAYDIAMAYFYVLPMHCEGQQHLEDARLFLREFLNGYQQESAFDPAWRAWFPLFLKEREIALYIAIHRSSDMDHLSPYEAAFMHGRREAILADMPYFPDVFSDL